MAFSIPGKFSYCICILIFAGSSWAAPTAATLDEWSNYVGKVERRIEHERGSTETFLPPLLPSDAARLLAGETLIQQFQAPAIRGGLIHHWAGTVFIPGVTLDQVQAITGDVQSFSSYYAPEIVSARVLSRSPQETRMLMRLRKDYIVSVVLEAEYRVQMGTLDVGRRFSNSRSARVQEVQDLGTPSETLVPSGQDHGFLWAMNSYWSYQQAADGVYIRCETLSLSRDIPFGMRWLIGPVVSRMPRQGLRFTLEATRNAVLGNSAVSISKNLEHSR